MIDQNLPTPAQILARAADELRAATGRLDAAADWLRSDWPPGMSMTTAQAGRRNKMRKAIQRGKNAIEAALR